MPKLEFVKVHLLVLGLLSVMFLLVPLLITRLPPGMINLPNKDYWLAPERRASTARTIQGYMVGFGDAMRASLMPVPHLPNRIWALLVLLAAFTLIWTVRLLRAFRRPK